MIISILLVLAGAALALFERITSAISKPDFNWQIFWSKNLFLSIYNGLIGVLLVIGVGFYNPELDVVVSGWDVTGLMWVLIGFMALYVWKLLNNLFKKLIGNVFKKVSGE